MPREDIENRVVATICTVLGAKFRRRDRGGTQTRDFDLIFSDRPPEPLEVTESSIESIRWTQGRLRETDRDAPSLGRWWTLDMPSAQLAPNGELVAYDIRALLDKAEPWLAALEAAGQFEFDIGRERYRIERSSPLYKPYEGLLRLGVTLGLSSEPPAGETGRISPSMAFSSTNYGEPLKTLVGLEADDPGNQKKLQEPAGAEGRHLAVLVDPSVGRSYHGLKHGEPGNAPSSLPAPITTAWAIADVYVAGVTPPGAWIVHRIDNPQVFDEPQLWEAEED
jgi:hypothetical protein